MKRVVAAAILFMSMCASAHAADIKHVVDETIGPMMARNDIAGMAVGVVVDGKPYLFDYGVASKETKRPVTRDTLFEIGSISKTMTATLTAYAAQNGKLSLADPVSRHLPQLRGTPFGDDVTLLNLGTHTPGGLPLQVPDEIENDTQLITWFKAWRPQHAAGTYRTYANPGIGTLGLITAKSMGQDFHALMQKRLFPAFGMTSSFIDVPASRNQDYAQGYAKDNKPVRMKGDELWAEAYGVRTTATDLTRFMQANMNDAHDVPAPWRRAVIATHTAYFQAGPMTQDLIWEQYPYPVEKSALLEGNAPAMITHGSMVTRIDPPHAPRDDVWINKTGSTNGFGAYIAFVPGKRVGIVMLANRNMPNSERVEAAYAILSALTKHE
jgi:beta-lactamase class C